jgi:tripartite-type tricarboxylate transporter receptor subunit TctC
MKICLVVSAVSASLVCAFAHAQQAPQYPRRSVNVILPFSAGGATDVLARTATQKMSGLLGQQFVIVNRDGAGGAIGTEQVAKATPDGYTLLWGSSGPLSINPNLATKLPFDPVKDFSPIGVFSLNPLVLVVHPSVPATSVKSLIAIAKARPGKLTFASSGTGAAPHFAGEMFKGMSGIDLLHVPYKGASQFVVDLLSGQVDLAFTAATGSRPHILTGRMRALAVTSARRTDLMPDLPTVAEAGLPGYELVIFYGLLAPAGTPAPIISLLNETLHKAAEAPEVRERIVAEGAYPAGGTPAQFGQMLVSEMKKFGQLARQAGLTQK